MSTNWMQTYNINCVYSLLWCRQVVTKSGLRSSKTAFIELL